MEPAEALSTNKKKMVLKFVQIAVQNDINSFNQLPLCLFKRGEELLLARGLAPRKHHSCLAGFVEAGESVEDTIHREIMEEVNIEVENVHYFGSQPWPFPSNLMLGYIADYKSGDIRVDETEITDAKWFTKDNPPEVLPPPISIARQMIDSIWNQSITTLTGK